MHVYNYMHICIQHNGTAASMYDKNTLCNMFNSKTLLNISLYNLLSIFYNKPIEYVLHYCKTLLKI